MASSEVDLCNSALIHLGAGLITSLSDNSDEARACNQFYDKSRDSVLTQANWTFATTQQELSKDVATPLFGYSYQYSLPTDPYCLKPLIIDDPNDEVDWKIHGRKLLTDKDGVYLQYIARITDLSLQSPLFDAALELYLAYRMAYTITGSRAVMEDMKSAYLEALADAEDVDGQIGIPEDFDTTDLVYVRT